MIEVNMTKESAGFITGILGFLVTGNNWMIFIMLIIVLSIAWLAVTQIPTLVATFPELNRNIVKLISNLASLSKKLKKIEDGIEDIKDTLKDI